VRASNRKAYRKVFLGFILAAIFAACSVPQTKIYSLALRNDGPAAKIETDASLDLVVRSPRYLSQPYIALRTSPYQLEIARYSKWDTPPAEMVRDSFRNALSATGLFREVKASNSVPPDCYSLEIYLQRFERLDSGGDSFADLAFDLDLSSPEGKSLYRGSFRKKIKLAGRDFRALAEAMSGALADRIDEVKAEIARALKKPL
jgi:uncharacterized lipoprotein YmbA